MVLKLLGWIDGGLLLADRDPVKQWHRWIGTALGFAGGVLVQGARHMNF